MTEQLDQRLLAQVTANTELSSTAELEAATSDFRRVLTDVSGLLTDSTDFNELRQVYESFHAEVASRIKEYGERPDGFDVVVYGLGGPDVAGVEGLLADNGILVSVGEENIIALNELANMLHHGTDMVTIAKLAYSQAESGLYASPIKRDLPSRGLNAYLTNLILGNVIPQTVSIDERKVLRSNDQNELGSMTKVSFQTADGRRISHILFSGIHLELERPLLPNTDQGIFVISELRDVLPNDGSLVVGVSKGSHRRGVLPFSRELPSRSTIVTDIIGEHERVDRVRRRFRLERNPVTQVHLSKPAESNLRWGYAGVGDLPAVIYLSRLR